MKRMKRMKRAREDESVERTKKSGVKQSRAEQRQWAEGGREGGRGRTRPGSVADYSPGATGACVRPEFRA
jgi:hypothetical protein